MDCEKNCQGFSLVTRQPNIFGFGKRKESGLPDLQIT